MITLQPSKETPPTQSVSKKRKWDQDIHEKPPAGSLGPINPDILLEQNQTRKTLLPGWQRCLDIKVAGVVKLKPPILMSGKAYLYDARTTAPRASCNSYNEPRPPTMMSLELKLNDLPHHQSNLTNNNGYCCFMDANAAKKDIVKGIAKSPSWLSLEGGEKQEMVAAACKKCYMLVMMSKSLRSCPNCKFVHPLESVQTFSFQG